MQLTACNFLDELSIQRKNATVVRDITAKFRSRGPGVTVINGLIQKSITSGFLL